MSLLLEEGWQAFDQMLQWTCVSQGTAANASLPSSGAFAGQLPERQGETDTPGLSSRVSMLQGLRMRFICEATHIFPAFFVIEWISHIRPPDFMGEGLFRCIHRLQNGIDG